MRVISTIVRHGATIVGTAAETVPNVASWSLFGCVLVARRDMMSIWKTEAEANATPYRIDP